MQITFIDVLLIKYTTKDVRLSKIINTIESNFGDIRKVLVKTESDEGIYPVTNLRFLELVSESIFETPVDYLLLISISNNRPKRNAAIKASKG